MFGIEKPTPFHEQSAREEEMFAAMCQSPVSHGQSPLRSLLFPHKFVGMWPHARALRVTFCL